MNWLLIPTHAAALVAWALATKWEVKRNAGLALTAALPLWPHQWAMAASVTGLLLLFGGYFLRVFNPSLNMLRGKAKFYASIDPHAALFPDRLSVWIAKLCERETGITWTMYLASVNESILNASLAITILLYIISIKLLCIWQ